MALILLLARVIDACSQSKNSRNRSKRQVHGPSWNPARPYSSKPTPRVRTQAHSSTSRAHLLAEERQGGHDNTGDEGGGEDEDEDDEEIPEAFDDDENIAAAAAKGVFVVSLLLHSCYYDPLILNLGS